MLKRINLNLRPKEGELASRLMDYYGFDRTGLVRYLIREEARRVGLVTTDELTNGANNDPRDLPPTA